MIGVILVAFLVVPLLEIYVIIQVGHAIGAWWTVIALLAESAFGAWLVKREGARAWRNLVSSLSEGRSPTRAAADGAVVLVGGVLLLTPGFITDAMGFLCVIPVTRPLVRRLLIRLAGRRGQVSVIGAEKTGRPGQVRHDVIEGWVVDDDPDEGKPG